mmetsp:Transcript_10400/g.39350  ORF Transcript_10400/g.39350 Transcript_10400/m.39350 type:complete len:114 (-) Transcript_10400:53-394(-)
MSAWSHPINWTTPTKWKLEEAATCSICSAAAHAENPKKTWGCSHFPSLARSRLDVQGRSHLNCVVARKLVLAERLQVCSTCQLCCTLDHLPEAARKLGKEDAAAQAPTIHDIS